jgi:AraC family transcriptional regulator
VVEMSPCRFARVFKAAVGLPPHQFVLRKRIARARDLLEASAAPLAEISGSLGFESQSHFTATFHKLVGTTPALYRNRQRH